VVGNSTFKFPEKIKIKVKINIKDRGKILYDLNLIAKVLPFLKFYSGRLFRPQEQ